MINYLLFNDDGQVVQRGQCSSESDIPRSAEWRVEIIEPDDARRPANLCPAPSYAELRRTSYPPVAEQLGMLWHAMDAGPSVRIEPFYSSLKAVKEAYPKPSN